MSARGHCYDNAPLESFFSLLKRERLKRQTYQTREQAKADIDASRNLTHHLIEEEYIKKPTTEMLEACLEKAIAQMG